MGTSMNLPCSELRFSRGRPMRPRRRCYGLEHLEPRHLPSMTLPGIAFTGPADGAVVVQAPQTFTITFDQQVADQDEADFGAMIGIPADQVLPTVVAVDSGQDFEIQQVGPEGSTSSVLGGTSAWSLQEAVATSTAPNGSSVTQLVITPQGGSPALCARDLPDRCDATDLPR